MDRQQYIILNAVAQPFDGIFSKIIIACFTNQLITCVGMNSCITFSIRRNKLSNGGDRFALSSSTHSE